MDFEHKTDIDDIPIYDLLELQDANILTDLEDMVTNFETQTT